MASVVFELLLVFAAVLVAFYFLRPSGPSAGDDGTPTGPMQPFMGCGLVGKDIDPSKNAWRGLIAALKKTNPQDKVPTWNWDVSPHNDENINADFLFFPNSQCGGIKEGQASGFPIPGSPLDGGARVATIALGSNEPDQDGYCMTYESGNPGLKSCSGHLYNENKCQTAPCKCKDWTAEHGCIYDVTGCGFWNLDCKTSFPWECFGKKATTDCTPGCKNGNVAAFKSFYETLGGQSYSGATTPLLASDITFNDQLMEAAGCGTPEVKSKKGTERLKAGCPTHSAFHFYSEGCPNDVPTSIQGFKDKVAASKELNAKYGLDGTIVNELGSLKGSDGSCDDAVMARMMHGLFDHLRSDAGRGVVSQMVWFNQNQVGGTFDLRLVKGDSESLLGTAYKEACEDWASDNAT